MNEIFGWLWIGVGFSSGAFLGLYFHHEDWLGGYSSFRRRLLRLAHIACVALGALNVLFGLSGAHLAASPELAKVASIGLIAGAITMPLACVLTAWRTSLRYLFPLPVFFLLASIVAILAALPTDPGSLWTSTDLLRKR